MISNLVFVDAKGKNPYENLAIEEYLTKNVKENQCILYLWQNRRTVVVGKNQNCWKECHISSLEKDDGYLARRLSGGGAVYQDLGNLNFTFCVMKEDYNVEKQLQVILNAVKMLGINAEKSGRNDITVDGRKFSGNAFLRIGRCCYHHGTIMIQVNVDDLSRYLNVDRSKLASKGVESVRSRVACLTEFNSDITVDMVKEALKKSFSDIYGLPYTEISQEELPKKEINALKDKFESWEWKYGRKIPFDYEIGRRFQWGDIQVQIHVESGVIKEISMFSDAMAQEIIQSFSKCLEGIEYSTKAMSEAIMGVNLPDNSLINNEELEIMRNDLVELIREEI